MAKEKEVVVANEVESSEEDKSVEESNKKVSRTVKKKGIMGVQVDSDPKELLKWVQEGGNLAFDPDSLPYLSDEELEPFPYVVVKAYKEARKESMEKVNGSGIEVLDTLGNNATHRLKIRKRRGYHQVWKRPDQFDDAKALGYVVVREAKTDKEADNPGTESGPIRKIGREDEPELIAMEIPQERKDLHTQAQVKKSRRAYQANKERFAGSVEQFNRNLPKADRMKVVDDEGDVS